MPTAYVYREEIFNDDVLVFWHGQAKYGGYIARKLKQLTTTWSSTPTVAMFAGPGLTVTDVHQVVIELPKNCVLVNVKL